MENLPKFFKYLLSTAFIVWIAGCGAGGRTQSSNFDAATDEHFSSRRQPAQISQAKGEELSKKGYLDIGRLSIDQVIRECWEDSRTGCEKKRHRQDATTELLEQAGDKGADIVVLIENNVEKISDLSKQGKCMQRTYDCRWQLNLGEVCANYCDHYHTVRGKRYTQKSSGTLWRKDSKAAKRVHGKKTLIEALKKGDTAKIEQALKEGLKVNRPLDGKTPLHIAASYNKTEMVGLLMDHGADPNAPDSRDIYPLHYASPDITRLLLDGGANPDVQDREDNTPLLIAARYGKVENVRLLLAKGASPNIENKYGSDPLYEVVTQIDLSKSKKKKILSIAKMLLERGAAPNKRDGDGRTPIYRAVLAGNPEIVSLLLAHGAKPNIKDDNGTTPLSKTYDFDTMKILLEAGADPNVPANKGGPMLLEYWQNTLREMKNDYYKEGYRKIIELLKRHGAK